MKILFDVPCFIRKNNKEIQEKLANIGYKICSCSNFEDSIWLGNLIINGTIHGKGYIDRDMEDSDWTQEKELNRFIIENPKYVDCGTNEELFLAIAALRSDSDYMQYFTNGTEYILCEREDWMDMFSILCSGGKYNYDKNGELSKNFHKATSLELISHFK